MKASLLKITRLLAVVVAFAAFASVNTSCADSDDSAEETAEEVGEAVEEAADDAADAVEDAGN